MAERGLNANKLAILLGVSPGVVHHLLKDGRCGLDLFNRLHAKLHVSANVMLDQDPPSEFRGFLPAGPARGSMRAAKKKGDATSTAGPPSPQRNADAHRGARAHGGR